MTQQKPPYQVGDRIRALINKPGQGTILVTCIVGKVEPRDGQQWTVYYRPSWPNKPVQLIGIIRADGSSDSILNNPEQPTRLPPPPAHTPPIYGQESKDIDPVVYAHYYEPAGGDFYVTEYDPKTGECFGWSEVRTGEGGKEYLYLTDLERNRPLMKIDEQWTPEPLSDVLKQRNK